MYGDWLVDPNDYECPICGGEGEISTYAGPTLCVKCQDHECDGWFQESGAVELLDPLSDGPPEFRPPDEWVVGDVVGTFHYNCPDCGSNELDRTGYDDGLGHVDVRIVCRDCEASAWE